MSTTPQNEENAKQVTYNEENAKQVIDVLRRNYEDQITTNRRMADRTSLVTAGTVTAFGVISALKPGAAAPRTIAGWLFGVAVLMLFATFIAAYRLWRAQNTKQPLIANAKSIWNDDVCTSREYADARLINSLCECLQTQRHVTDDMGCTFRCFYFLAMTAIVLLAIAELIG